MKLLLDTHAYLWLRLDPSRLSHAASQAIAAENNTLALSLVSLWEMTIKAAKGQLELPFRNIAEVADELPSVGIALLGVSIFDVVALEGLPSLHRDPFDRLLIAQSLAQDFVLVTNDAMIQAYGISTLW